jgi:hypothetical protein
VLIGAVKASSYLGRLQRRFIAGVADEECAEIVATPAQAGQPWRYSACPVLGVDVGAGELELDVAVNLLPQPL